MKWATDLRLTQHLFRFIFNRQIPMGWVGNGTESYDLNVEVYHSNF